MAMIFKLAYPSRCVSDHLHRFVIDHWINVGSVNPQDSVDDAYEP